MRNEIEQTKQTIEQNGLRLSHYWANVQRLQISQLKATVREKAKPSHARAFILQWVVWSPKQGEAPLS